MERSAWSLLNCCGHVPADYWHADSEKDSPNTNLSKTSATFMDQQPKNKDNASNNRHFNLRLYHPRHDGSLLVGVPAAERCNRTTATPWWRQRKRAGACFDVGPR